MRPTRLALQHFGTGLSACCLALPTLMAYSGAVAGTSSALALPVTARTINRLHAVLLMVVDGLTQVGQYSTVSRLVTYCHVGLR